MCSCKKNSDFAAIENFNQCLEFSSQCSSAHGIVAEFILVIAAVNIFITACWFPPENLNSTVAEASERRQDHCWMQRAQRESTYHSQLYTGL